MRASRASAAALADAPAGAIAAFAAAGIVHFLLGWTFLNLSQKRIGAARTAPLLTFAPLFGLPVAAITVGDLPEPAELVAIVPMVAGRVGGRGRAAACAITDAVFGLGCALMWAISPVFAVEGFDGIRSPLLGVSIGLVAAAAGLRGGAGRARLRARGRSRAARCGSSSWPRCSSRSRPGGAGSRSTTLPVGVVLALGLLSVPVVLFLAPLIVGRASRARDARASGRARRWCSAAP